ncbi:multidrug effflux MFS transporter [Plastorhodobacter daqingensis]|uniref:Bcr/CflA family efflux transporter n=1 Tax=Plastorhodobacter daqingensis TaxID=1387281 RepID=A0ABW2UKP7_9RHOB
MTVRPDVRFLDRRTPPHVMTLVLLAGLSALAMNIFLPSLPNMTAFFNTEYRLMQLSVSLYLAMNAVLQIFIGPISDRFGRRPVLLWTMALFLVATLGTLLSTSIEVFLLFRMAQAIVVSTMVLSRAAVRDMVSQDEAASVLGYVTMGMAIVPMMSPMIGGVLDELWGWQASFVLLFVIGAAILALTWADMGETATIRPITLAAQFRQYPELLVSPRFWGYCLAAAFASGSFFAYLGGAPYVGSEVFGMTPAMLGLYFGAPALGYGFGNFLSGRYSVRVGVNNMVLWGTLITFFGLALLIILFIMGFATPELFFGLFISVGLGNGMVLPNATAGMLSVRPHLAGTASGLGGAIMIAGGAILSALAGALLGQGSGPMPLLLLMFGSACASVLSILYVIRRARQVGA